MLPVEINAHVRIPCGRFKMAEGRAEGNPCCYANVAVGVNTLRTMMPKLNLSHPRKQAYEAGTGIHLWKIVHEVLGLIVQLPSAFSGE